MLLETLILDRMFNRELRQLLLNRIKTEDLEELASVISFIQVQEIPSSGLGVWGIFREILIVPLTDRAMIESILCVAHHIF